MEQRERNRTRAANWYRENREHHSAKMQDWRSANPERAREITDDWRRRNPERANNLDRKKSMAHRARQAGVRSENVDPGTVFMRDEGICGVCREPVDAARFEIDHIVPMSAGGPHTYDNVQLAHSDCNKRKGTKLPDELVAA